MGRKNGKTGVRYGTPYTELGKAMRDDQAHAALLIIDALERTGWRIMRAAALLGYRDYGQLDDYITRLGMRKLVQDKRREAWTANLHVTSRPMTLVELMRLNGDREGIRALLLNALHARKGNELRAARDLNMPLTTLRKYVRQVGVRPTLVRIRLAWDGNPKARAQYRAMARRKARSKHG